LFSDLTNFSGIFVEGFRKARRNIRQGSYLKGKSLIQYLLNVKCNCVLTVTAERESIRI